MAQNISLWGANYSAVPSVLLPKQGGGTASFVDVTGTTAAAGDVASGKLFYSALGVLTTGTASGGSGLTYETGTYTPTANADRPTISFASTHTTCPFFVGITDATGNDASQNSNLAFALYNFQRAVGSPFNYNASQTRAGIAVYAYRGSSSASGSSIQIRYPDTDAGSGSTNYMRYFVTESGFMPTTNSTTRYWRSGRTYKWIAVWM